ncbi:hypothetical protein DH2020_015822 [Rehmannia glutinosa]|uniref:Endonuclease/exonuclease/phosphatase domain-containing protein n=1 Tax=Rehmannia glutinosa TaxID=99300 RepID=A0ABR0WUK7_REHGL
MEVIGIHPQVIHVLATCLITHHINFVSFVYGLNKVADRKPLWEELERIRMVVKNPWLLVGDFNSVLSSGDRKNGAPTRPFEIKDFNNCCSTLGLSDLPSKGHFFTWTNNSVWSKLDRAMVDNDWLLDHPHSEAHFLPSGISDHSPCIVSMSLPSSIGKAPWRFFNMWTDHDDFIPLVQDNWQRYIRGTAQFKLRMKLKLLKADLKELNSKHYSHISSRALKAKTELKEAQSQLESSPGIKEPDTRNILSFSHLSQGSMPFRYLGIPLTAERLKVAHFEELTKKIRTYIDGWSALTLSYAGRAELIRSVLQGVECYWISIFPLPDAVCTKIVKLCHNFLWGTSSKKVAWASICHPKSEGGLGFRDLRAWNNALLAKTLWNIHAKKDTLWHKWIQRRLSRNRPLWTERKGMTRRC